jgi:hypothetical protein
MQRRRRRRSSILAELEAKIASKRAGNVTLESFAASGLVTSQSSVLLTGRPCSSCKDGEVAAPDDAHGEPASAGNGESNVDLLISEARRSSRRRSSLGGGRRRRSSCRTLTAPVQDSGGDHYPASDDVPTPLVTDWAQRRHDILRNYVEQKYKEFAATNVRAWRMCVNVSTLSALAT